MLRADAADAARPALVAVRVRVAGARPPLKLFLYLDGDLVAGADAAVGAWDLQLDVAPGRHALTARATDALGRWGSRSVVVEPAEAGGVAPAPVPLDRAASRSSRAPTRLQSLEGGLAGRVPAARPSLEGGYSDTLLA